MSFMPNARETHPEGVPVGLCGCGCGQPTKLPGSRYKTGHWQRTIPDRAYAVDAETGCWNWLGCVQKSGYGRCGSRPAHRIFYERAKGPVPSGLFLDHLCRNRRCVNPDHLEPVTTAENNHRGDLTRLTADEVAAIRAAVAGGETRMSVAQRMGLHEVTVQRIVAGARWKSGRWKS